MQRPDPMIALSRGVDVQAMAARTLWLEELFFLDARTISHPQHGLFTGLASTSKPAVN